MKNKQNYVIGLLFASCTSAVFNTQIIPNHEYKATTLFAATGTYKYFFRFSGDGGDPWISTPEHDATIN